MSAVSAPHGNHAHDIETAAYARVSQNGQVTFNSICNGRERTRGRRHAIQLSAAVIGHHDPIGTKAHGIPRIFRI